MNVESLSRLLNPVTIAVVGASEKLGMSNNAVLPMLDVGRNVYLVNPNRDRVYDRPCAPNLDALGEPIDAVLSLVSAERAIDVVAEAASLGCGGVVVAAGGYAELGHGGAGLQHRLVEAAGPEMAVMGPNCSGFLNVRTNANLFTGGRIKLDPGATAVISQSGFLLRSCLAAGLQRRLGFGVAISSGNEAVCDIADYIELLADDPETSVICLVIEKIRDASAFLASVARARASGKGVIALKLGRSERSRHIMRSHTGAIADESWVYDLVFRQAGVVTAGDVDDLLDRAQLLSQLHPAHWRPIRGVAVMASSGGVAGVAADQSLQEDVELPELAPLRAWVRQRIRGEDSSLNPLDLTGFVMRDRALLVEMFRGYAEAVGVDALVLCWWAGEGDEGWARTLLDPFAEVAAASGIPLVVTPVEATAIGAWTAKYRESGLTFCRGLRATFRAIRALSEVAAGAPSGRTEGPSAAPAAVPFAAPRLVDSPAGRIVGFADSMAILRRVGVPVAPYLILPESVEPDADVARLGGRLVVKLADVPHRTELGAVRLGVTPADVAASVRELRLIAAAHSAPGTVVVQQMLHARGEAFIGIQGDTDFGPLVLFGRGGILLELAARVGGRLLPLGSGAARSLVAEIADQVGVLRGEPAWPLDQLEAALEGIASAWQETASWLRSADINPLIITDDGVVAVDALFVARS